MTKKEEILYRLRNPIFFDSPLTVKSSPHNMVVRIYGLDRTSEDEIMVQISDGTFHVLEEKDKNYDMVANSILQRLRLNENK